MRQRRLCSDLGNAQADLSLRWAHMPFCWFCHEAAHLQYLDRSVCDICLHRFRNIVMHSLDPLHKTVLEVEDDRGNTISYG